MTVHSVEILMA